MQSRAWDDEDARVLATRAWCEAEDIEVGGRLKYVHGGETHMYNPDVIASLQRAARLLGGGVSAFLFPEGTRTRDGSLQPLKKGGFRLAMESGLPLVPVTIVGTRRAMPRASCASAVRGVETSRTTSSISMRWAARRASRRYQALLAGW